MDYRSSDAYAEAEEKKENRRKEEGKDEVDMTISIHREQKFLCTAMKYEDMQVLPPGILGKSTKEAE